MHVTHIITDLATGGAEMMLLKLVQYGGQSVRHSVISLRSMGTIGPQLEQAGAKVFALNLRASRIPGLKAWKLVEHLSELKPDLIQGWMYHGNVAASVGQFVMSPRPALCWSIRCTLHQDKPEKWLTGAIVMLGRALSSKPASVIYNSDRARRQHEQIGYCSGNSTVIPNGFDIRKFYPSEAMRTSMRRRFGLPLDGVVLGMLARLHPMKDHQTFLRAAAEVIRRWPNAYFVAAGRDVPRLAASEQSLVSLCGQRLILLPEQADVSGFMNGLDLAILSSAWGEGFPNVLGEAMCCGIPCIATDIGDCGSIIGDTGIVVPPRNVEKLTAAVTELVSMSGNRRSELALRARERVAAKFSMESVASRYEKEWLRATSAADCSVSPRLSS